MTLYLINYYIPYKMKYWWHFNSKIICFTDLLLAVNARGRDSNTLVYTWVRSFCRFNFGGPYQNCQSTKLKSTKFKCYMVTVYTSWMNFCMFILDFQHTSWINWLCILCWHLQWAFNIWKKFRYGSWLYLEQLLWMQPMLLLSDIN